MAELVGDNYQGSMRNYSLSPVEDLKSAMEQTGDIEWVRGHTKAAGCCISNNKADDFVRDFNELYKDVPSEPVYWVDYEWTESNVDGEKILDIGRLDIYGQGIQESRVEVSKVSLGANNVILMSPDKHPTLKIRCGDVDIIKFKSSQEEYEKFCENGKLFSAICKCQVNEWNGKISPQLIVEDYKIEDGWVF